MLAKADKTMRVMIGKGCCTFDAEEKATRPMEFNGPLATPTKKPSKRPRT